MNIAVCLKQVPHPDYLSKIIYDPTTNRLQRAGVPLIINPVDKNAIETGIQLKEKYSGEIIVITMGPPQAKESLEEALAMGADEAILLCDPDFAGADTYATAFTLASALKKIGLCDLILCGNETLDSGTSQVGPQIAAFLDIPHVTNVKAINYPEDGLLLVERSLENGYMRIKVRLPALLTVTKEINKPRIPSAIGIMQVAGKPFNTWGLAELNLSSLEVGLAGSPIQTVQIPETEQRHAGDILQGDVTKVVKTAVAKLHELKMI